MRQWLLARNATGCILAQPGDRRNYAGVNLNHCTTTSLVNCTVANTDSWTPHRRVRPGDGIHNLFTYAATGITIGTRNRTLVIDHNLYIANFVGKQAKEAVRKKVGGLGQPDGYDKHSLTLGVTFTDARMVIIIPSRRFPGRR